MDRKHERGLALRRWREVQQPRVGLTELSRRIREKLGHGGGCDPSYLRRFENGEATLSIPIAGATSDVTGVPIELLLSERQLSDIRIGAAKLELAEQQPEEPAPEEPAEGVA